MLDSSGESSIYYFKSYQINQNYIKIYQLIKDKKHLFLTKNLIIKRDTVHLTFIIKDEE